MQKKKLKLLFICHLWYINNLWLFNCCTVKYKMCFRQNYRSSVLFSGMTDCICICGGAARQSEAASLCVIQNGYSDQ